jgi:hypothetical protein
MSRSGVPITLKIQAFEQIVATGVHTMLNITKRHQPMT